MRTLTISGLVLVAGGALAAAASGCSVDCADKLNCGPYEGPGAGGATSTTTSTGSTNSTSVGGSGGDGGGCVVDPNCGMCATTIADAGGRFIEVVAGYAIWIDTDGDLRRVKVDGSETPTTLVDLKTVRSLTVSEEYIHIAYKGGHIRHGRGSILAAADRRPCSQLTRGLQHTTAAATAAKLVGASERYRSSPRGSPRGNPRSARGGGYRCRSPTAKWGRNAA